MEGKRKGGESLGSMDQQFEIKIERSVSTDKTDVLEELIQLLRSLLEYCLCCLSCGCIPLPQQTGGLVDDSYEMILLESERQAVGNLLHYLEHEANGEPVLNEEHVRALSILAYSDNVELQKSAALCFTEISERTKAPLTIPVAKPLVKLLRSRDLQVQKSATLAVSNFTLQGPDSNKATIGTCGGVEALVCLLQSSNTDVQCNTAGCITTLATTDANKQQIIEHQAIHPLLRLMKSQDLRVQRNAAGAVLNLTHLQNHRNDLVAGGVIPVLVDLLQSPDQDIQYYSAASLSNIAVNEKHRALMVAIGHTDVIRNLIRLVSAKEEKVQCQACLALRNLASDGNNQPLIVKYGALPRLQKVLRTGHKDTLVAAVACLRNLSIHKANEVVIMTSNFVIDLCHVMCDSHNPEAQRHAAGIIRNLAVGQYIRDLIEHDCVEALTFVLLGLETRMNTLKEVTAALAVFADEDDVKYKLLHLHGGKVFSKLVTLATLSTQSEVQYNSVGTLGQLFLVEIPEELKTVNINGIVLYIDTFLKSPDPNFIHIALWTLVQLLKDPVFLKSFQDHSIAPVIVKLASALQPSTIEELATTVLKKLRGEEESTSSDD
ncbi:vacuolar protein 8-like [Mizuhopecten yessoensis]|uniref:Vacuolar protein 8 n=1 Tax=Mizuhopecten yessoensis TaxID=6573 RepID=A0A210Q471_MIZYE|nr:vacuolar protein 8-like [Mizuhopecten yessoensis]OWF43479.1 Vacuolar protein 8 [Mizuhopecten yessoensis]